MRYLLSAIAFLAILACSKDPPAATPVADAKAAISIAVPALKSAYGSEKIDLQRPLTAKLEGDRWHVQGTLLPGSIGGVAEAWIAKDDGRVLQVTHGQ